MPPPISASTSAPATGSRALAIAPNDFSTRCNCACAYCPLGDVEHALDLLEHVALVSTPEQALWIRPDSDLDAVRDHPRFAELLEVVDQLGRSGEKPAPQA